MERLPEMLDILLTAEDAPTAKYLMLTGYWNRLIDEGMQYKDRLKMCSEKFCLGESTVRQFIHLVKRYHPERLHDYSPERVSEIDEE